MGKCSARREECFMCTFRTPRQTPSKTAKCILSSSFFTQAMPWRSEGVEHSLGLGSGWCCLTWVGHLTKWRKDSWLVAASSSLVYWRVSPPVKRETGIQFPDGEAVLNLLYCFGPGLSRRKAKRRAICIGRESNGTQKTRQRVGVHRDLNSDHWIQSPEC